MDRQLLNKYREGWQAVESFEQSENQRATLEQRWIELNLIYKLAADLNLAGEEDRDQVDIVRQRWSDLKNK